MVGADLRLVVFVGGHEIRCGAASWYWRRGLGALGDGAVLREGSGVRRGAKMPAVGVSTSATRGRLLCVEWRLHSVPLTGLRTFLEAAVGW